MTIPNRIPGYRLLLILLGVYGAVWIALEGNLLRVSLLALLLTMVMLVWTAQRILGGRTLPLARWLVLMTIAGLVSALLANLLTLILMAVKTGLHAHGPEFTAAQIATVIERTPVWMIAGLLLGLGLGFLLAAFSTPAAAGAAEEAEPSENL